MSDTIEIIVEQQTSPVIKIPPQGTDGVGIASIELISTVDLVKTYRINYTNGNYFDFEVADGSDADCVWGQITGTLSDQTDLQNALDAKADADNVYTKTEIDAQKPTLLSQELKKGDTSVTFDVPTEGDNFIEIFTSVDGLDYELLDDSTAGKVTITYEAQAKDVTIFLKISGGAE